MQLSLWTYEGPPHVGAMRVATAMKGLHYVLHAKWKDTRSGIEYFYESEPLAEDPQKLRRMRQVPVFIDPEKPQRYRVDTSFMPAQVAAQRESAVQ